MRIGILGGTFNPPHIGHFVLAKGVSEQIGLDKVFFVPTNIPPHKEQDEVSPEHRLKMLELSLEGRKDFEILDLEIERGGVSYTVDTVKQLIKSYPEDDFYLMVGSDLANDFSSWKDFDELKKLVKIVVAQRNHDPLKSGNDFILAEITQIHISSSFIREHLKEGRSVDYLVNDKVLDYINKHNLYR